MAGFGLASARAAVRLERAAPIWFGFGAILGPIALLLLDAAPPGRCHSCSTPTRGWLTICGWCGEHVSATPPGATAVAASLARSPGLSSLSGGRDWVRGRDQASPLKQIRRARSAAPTSTPPIERTETPTSIPAEGIEPAPVETRMLTTAVYVTGSTSLESGRRYLIAVRGPRLQVLGPVETDPSTVALDRDLAEMDATASEGRLVISGPGGRSGTVLIFMSVAGTTPDMVAKAIVDAARTAAQA